VRSDRCQATHVVGVRYVSGDETCLATGIFDVLNRLRAALGVTAVHDDLGAFRGQLDGYRVADACCGTGY
jgi:hypothetical protein